ncbi:MAG: hypothetical protein WC107_04300 [Patescibacteria group bacterium]
MTNKNNEFQNVMALTKDDLQAIGNIIDNKIDDFAVTVAAGFGDMKEYMDKRFDQVDKRFEQVDQRFKQVDKRFEQVDQRFDQVDKRFDSMDFKIGLMQTDIKEIRAEIVKLNLRLDIIEKRTFEDTDLTLREIEKVKKRVLLLEKIVKIKTA